MNKKLHIKSGDTVMVINGKYRGKKGKVIQVSPTEGKVMKGLGIAILSTSKGILTDKQARAEHIGGEVLAFIW